MIWLTALSWLKKVDWKVWAALALVIAVLWLRSHWIGVGEDRVQARWDAQKAVYAAEREAARVAARQTEERHRAEYKAIAERFTREQEKANEEANRIIADLRSGNLRLRQRFTCPRMPETAGGSEGNHGADQAGLSERDVDFLIRFAERADTAARRLTACQQILGVQP